MIWVDLSDIETWPLNHFTGIQRVVVNVAKEMSEMVPDVRFFTYDPKGKIFYEIAGKSLIHAVNFQVKNLQRSASPIEFSSADCVLLLGGTWVHPDFLDELGKRKNISSFKIVHFIHDVTCIRVPHVHREKSTIIQKEWLQQVYRWSDAFLTNSFFSQHETNQTFKEMGLGTKEMAVVRLGDELVSHERGEPVIFSDQNLPYVLNVGSFEPRKNHILLYQVWKMLLTENPRITPHLVIVGSKGWLSEDLRSLILRDPSLTRKIIWLQSLDEPQLIWLYRHCLFTMYPSIYEGWGLPVAESLSYGKYCIASSAASIPEIAGNLIDYHGPYDSRECFNLVQQALCNPQYLFQKEQTIKNSYQITPWNKTAQQILKTISTICL